MKPLTGNMRADDSALTLKEYEAHGGYEAIKKARALTPSTLVQSIKDAGLLGRGGAGFNTGFKMGAVPPVTDLSELRYLVVNADEMEPGTFKDRWLLEKNPHQLLEGIMIAAHAIGARIAYIFLRGEYKTSETCIEQALHELSETSHAENLTIYLHMSAGRYICGEETALLNALEGRRATPRAKPPFPQTSGLFGRPTVVQNVETVSNLPHIVNNGGDWFKSLSKAVDAGTKIFGVSGKVKTPGAFELPMGTTAREIIYDHGGGMWNGHKLRAYLPGGASTDLLTEQFLDVPMDYSSMAKMKTRMGTGTIIVVDDHTCPVSLLANLQRFFKQESCGFCTPCREGLSWVHQILVAIENGDGRTEDLDILRQQGRLLAPGSTFCALAPGAAAPLLTALTIFNEDFLQHIAEKRCPYQAS